MYSRQQSQRFSTTLRSTCPNLEEDLNLLYMQKCRHSPTCQCRRSRSLPHWYGIQIDIEHNAKRRKDWGRKRSAEANLTNLLIGAPSSHAPELQNTRRVGWLAALDTMSAIVSSSYIDAMKCVGKHQ